MSVISAVTRWKLSSSQSAAGADELPGAHVVGQRAVGGAQHADVVLEAREGVAGAVARIGIDGEAGGERQRALLEPLDAQELVAERLGDDGAAPGEPREQRHHREGVACPPAALQLRQACDPWLMRSAASRAMAVRQGQNGLGDRGLRNSCSR